MAAGKAFEAGCSDIAELETLDPADLRGLWRGCFPADPPKRMSRELMMRAIAYKLQEKQFGGLSRRAKAKLRAYASGRSLVSDGKASRPKITVKPGTHLVRQWNGRMHTVVALEGGGFSYRDKRYRSLSQIAWQITGTKWSGPVFFGLKAAADASTEGDGVLPEEPQ